MSKEETDINHLFGDIEIQDEFSDEEVALLKSFSDTQAEETTEETKPEESNIIVPESEDDFLKKTGDENDADTNADDTDDSHDGDEGDNDSPDDDISSYFGSVAEGLVSLGKFDGMEIPEKWNKESFLSFYDEYTEKKIESGIYEQLTNKWGEEGEKMFNDIFVTGVDPREYFGKVNQVLDLESIDLSKEINQKAIISKYLEALGQDEEEILDQIEVLEEKGKLEERSEKYKEKLIEDNKRAVAKMTSEKEAQVAEGKRLQAARFNSIKDVVAKAVSAKEINGIPLNVADSKELFSYATAPAWTLPNGATITDAEKALMEIKKDPTKWVALCKLLKEDLNVSPIKAKGVDEKAQDVFNFKKDKKVAASKQKDSLDSVLKKIKF